MASLGTSIVFLSVSTEAALCRVSLRSDSDVFVSKSLLGFTENRKKKKSMTRSGEIRSLKAMMAGPTGGGGSGGPKYKGTQRRERQLTEMIEKKVIEAKEVCEGDHTSDECKVAWDEVEEVSQAKADLRLMLDKHMDPLENYCLDNPETDECRVYDP